MERNTTKNKPKRRKPRHFKPGAKERMKLVNKKLEATITKEKGLAEKLLKENKILKGTDTYEVNICKLPLFF